MINSQPASPGKPVHSEGTIRKPRNLTTKQVKFIKAKAEGKTGTQAAVEAYGVDEKTASVMASQNLSKLSIQEALQAEMAKQGITLEAIVAPVARALNAKRVVQIEGDFFETDVDDIPVQLKGTQFASQFLGLNKNDGTPVSVHFHQHVNDKKADYNF